MLALLVGLRDALIAMALAWIGVSIETRVQQAEPACGADSCEDVAS
ncbi:MAG: hypothetical protein R3C16_08445 [Hyphomonadaceae bacterium]